LGLDFTLLLPFSLPLCLASLLVVFLFLHFVCGGGEGLSPLVLFVSLFFSLQFFFFNTL
jgi:hypothetical protein